MDDPETWRWIWLGATAIFTAGEMAVAGSFFLAPFAVGAALATVLAFVDAPLVAQWGVFVVGSGASFAAFRPLARRLDATASHRVGATRLVSREGIVLEDIPDHGVGLVRVDREEWRAQCQDGRAIPAGAHVVIREVRGTRLIVGLAERTAPPANPPPANPPNR